MVGSQPGTCMGQQISSNLSRTSFPPLYIGNQHLSSNTGTSSNKRGIPSWVNHTSSLTGCKKKQF